MRELRVVIAERLELGLRQREDVEHVAMQAVAGLDAGGVDQHQMADALDVLVAISAATQPPMPAPTSTMSRRSCASIRSSVK